MTAMCGLGDVSGLELHLKIDPKKSMILFLWATAN